MMTAASDGRCGTESGDDGADAPVITVPRPEATIVVRAQDQKLIGIPNVGVMLRYNGIFLGAPIVNAMAQHQGRSFTTGPAGKLVLEHMPVGVYDFWPYFTASDAGRISRSPSADAPARLAAQPGPNALTLTFTRRDSTDARQ